MADVGFHGSERAWSVTAPPIGVRQRFELDRIPQSGAGTMRLNEIHRAPRYIGAAQRPGDHVALRERIRCGQTVGAAILIYY